MQPSWCPLMKIENNCHHRFFCLYTGWVDICKWLCETWLDFCSMWCTSYNVGGDFSLHIRYTVCCNEYMDSGYSCKGLKEQRDLSMLLYA